MCRWPGSGSVIGQQTGRKSSRRVEGCGPGRQVAGRQRGPRQHTRKTGGWADLQMGQQAGSRAEKQAGGPEDTWTVQMATWAKGFGHLPQGL